MAGVLSAKMHLVQAFVSLLHLWSLHASKLVHQRILTGDLHA